MSQPPEHLAVELVHREGMAKTCRVRLGGRQFLTPSFVIRIDSAEKFCIYLRSKRNHLLPHICGYVVRLTDAERILGRRIRGNSQLDLHGHFVDDDGFLKSSVSDLILIDPALENLYYVAHLSDFVLSQRIPVELVDYAMAYDEAKRKLAGRKTEQGDLRAWIEASHREFWGRLQRNERRRARFIRDILVRERELGATVLIPPVPLITSHDLFELTKTINSRSSEISRLLGECAHAFMFRVEALRDSSLMDDLTECIGGAKARLTILKFKYMNLNEEDRIVERDRFRGLIQELDLKSRMDSNRTFMLHEAGNQTFACAGRGFDFLSASFSVDREDRKMKRERNPWGKWYDPRSQIPLGREDFLEVCRNNGMRIPCDCPECLSITNPESLGLEEWNGYVKRHYLHSRNRDYTEVADAIQKGNVTAGTIDRLKDSMLKNLIELIR